MDSLHDLARQAKRRLKGCDEGKMKIEDNSYILEAVRDMICSEEIVTDPIGRLTDISLYESMDEIDRQRYILCLAEQYNRCKDKLSKRGA